MGETVLIYCEESKIISDEKFDEVAAFKSSTILHVPPSKGTQRSFIQRNYLISVDLCSGLDIE